MRDYLEPMLGTTGALIAQFAITLIVVAIIILIVFWLIRTFTGTRIGQAPVRGRQPRLSVLDALPVDQRRRLVLVRRDNVEHLILIGGPTDLVVESSIQRPSVAQRKAEAAARTGGPARGGIAPPPAAQRNEPVDDIVPPAEAFDEAPRRAIEAEPQMEPETLPPPAQISEPVSEPEPAPATRIIAQQQPQKPVRQLSSFLTSGRSRNAASDAPAEPQAEPRREVAPEPRRPEPPTRPLGRATPVAPRAPEPQPVDELPPEPAPPLAAPVRAPEPVRAAEPPRPAARPVLPPAPPVSPPDLGDEPYGAPAADADRPVRFEPIFDIDPADVNDPGRPVRPMRDSAPAPHVEPPRAFEEDVATEEVVVVETAESDQRSRASAVGDLEKEMARLLGEISGSRRT